jgi:hypothetical protein
VINANAATNQAIFFMMMIPFIRRAGGLKQAAPGYTSFL